MKNNKRILLILIPFSIVIWGLIGYEIVKTVEGPVAVEPIKKFMSTPNSTIDTLDFILKLNYEDPFAVSSSVKNSISSPKKKNISSKTKGSLASNTVEWPNIHYGGMVKSSSSREIALITIEGKDYLVSKGEEVENLMIKHYDANEIVIKFQNQEKIFKK